MIRHGNLSRFRAALRAVAVGTGFRVRMRIDRRSGLLWTELEKGGVFGSQWLSLVCLRDGVIGAEVAARMAFEDAERVWWRFRVRHQTGAAAQL